MNLNPRVKEYGSQKEILYTVKGSIEKVGALLWMALNSH